MTTCLGRAGCFPAGCCVDAAAVGCDWGISTQPDHFSLDRVWLFESDGAVTGVKHSRLVIKAISKESTGS